MELKKSSKMELKKKLVLLSRTLAFIPGSYSKTMKILKVSA